MKPSFISSAFAWILKVINFKKKIESRALGEKTGSQLSFPPAWIRRSYFVNLQSYEAKEIATFESKESVTRKHIIFFHGGAYLFKTTRAHWCLTQKIVRKSSCRMTHIDYPLAPEHNYRDTFQIVSGVYDLLLKQYPEDNFILMGDSSGGGLALAFAQKLAKEEHPKPPAKLLLLSPWLDLSLSNPDIEKLESSDHILSLKMLQYAARKYSDGDRQDQYLLSPLSGDFNKLPPTIIFYGTEELFCPDCQKMRSMTEPNKTNFLYREYQKMQHDWALFPLPESRQLVNEVCNFINDNKEHQKS